jgi:carbamoyl-phosphate synthase large subunit
MTEFNILVSSAGRRVELQNIWRHTLRALDLQGEVMAVDMSPMSAAYQSADRAFVVPACRDEAFIPAILDICERNRIKLIVPTIDTELPYYANARRLFDAIGTTVAVSSPAVVAIASDKAQTHCWLKRHGFPVPRQAHLEDVKRNCDDWSFPVVVKPRNGSASKGIVFATKRADLDPIDNAAEYVVEQQIHGVEYTLDLLVTAGGRCVCAVPRRRIAVRGGEVMKAQTCRLPELEALAARICETLPGAFGVLNIQMMLGDDGPAIIEINPRFGGGFPLAWEAGADYPKWMMEELLGRPSTASSDSWCDGVTMLRYDAAVYVDTKRQGND